MTLGENIQAHRKRLSISQDELGKMLYVTRQTVSMWETGQTAPTIDNLLRLGELFGISVDELLKGGGESEFERAERSANESYTYNYTNDELISIEKAEKAPLYKKVIYLFIGFIVLLVMQFTGMSDYVCGVSDALLIMGGVWLWRAFDASSKKWNAYRVKAASYTYKYTMYDSFIREEVFTSGKRMIGRIIPYEEISSVMRLDSHYLIYTGDGCCIIRKDELKESSLLYAYMHKHPERLEEQYPIDVWKTVSTILFTLSFVLPAVVLMLSVYLAGEMGSIPEKLWVSFILTPIPLASLGYGIFANSRGQKCNVNIVIGIVMLVFLCVAGCVSFFA